MNQIPDADLLLTAWFEATAPDHEPPHLVDEVLARVAGTPRRAAWRIPERWIPMQRTLQFQRVPSLVPILVVVGLLILAAVVALLATGASPHLAPVARSATTAARISRPTTTRIGTRDGTYWMLRW